MEMLESAAFWWFVCGFCASPLLLLWLRHLFTRWECTCGYRCFWTHNMLHHTELKHQHVCTRKP